MKSTRATRLSRVREDQRMDIVSQETIASSQRREKQVEVLKVGMGREMRWKTWRKERRSKSCGVELSLFWAEARQPTVARE